MRDIAAIATDLRLGKLYRDVVLSVTTPGVKTMIWTDMVGIFEWELLPNLYGGHCMGPTFIRHFSSGQVVKYALDTISQKIRIGQCTSGNAEPTFVPRTTVNYLHTQL
jgi:hypothetical protein